MMKFLALVVLLATAAQADKSLPDAMAEMKAVLRLAELAGTWNMFRNGNNDVCKFSNELNKDEHYPAAFAHIFDDTYYQMTRTRMNDLKVEWDNFILHDLKPALGVHAIVDNCPPDNLLGGMIRFREELRYYVDEPLIDATIVRLRAESSAFDDWQNAVEENQGAVHDLRCSPPLQKVFGVMHAAGVDLDLVMNIFLRVLFGGAAALPC